MVPLNNFKRECLAFVRKSRKVTSLVLAERVRIKDNVMTPPNGVGQLEEEVRQSARAPRERA